MERLFAAVDAGGERLDLVIYNASGRARGPIVELDPEAVENAIRVTAFGGFLVARQAATRMLRQGHGTILFTGASASVKGYPRSSSFAMGKFALRGLAQSLARELQPQNIHVGHIVIDGGIGRPGDARAKGRGPDALLDPDAIAETYLQLHRQHRSAWAWEIELRPWVENFFGRSPRSRDSGGGRRAGSVDGAALGVRMTAAAADTAVVRLEHIGKRYGAGAPILSDISLSLDPGGFCLLTGAGGAGKTMLLRICPSPSGPTAAVSFCSAAIRAGSTGPRGRRCAAASGSCFRTLRIVEDWSVARQYRAAVAPRRNGRARDRQEPCRIAGLARASKSGSTRRRRHCPAASGSLSRSRAPSSDGPNS